MVNFQSLLITIQTKFEVIKLDFKKWILNLSKQYYSGPNLKSPNQTPNVNNLKDLSTNCTLWFFKFVQNSHFHS